MFESNVKIVRVEARQIEMFPWGGGYKGVEGTRSFLGKLLEPLDSGVEPGIFWMRAIRSSRSDAGQVKGSGKTCEIPGHRYGDCAPAKLSRWSHVLMLQRC
jgi:hypothetical protein